MSRSFAQKLGLKPDVPIYLNSVPKDYYEKTELKRSESFEIFSNKKYYFCHIFSKSQEHLIDELERITKVLDKDGLLWISWPKKSSKITSSLDKWLVMEIGQAAGLVDVKILSYNDDWSSLKFVYRLKDR